MNYKTEIANVVGITFAPGYPGTVRRLRDTMDDWHGALVGDDELLEQGPAVVLVREPDNPHDPNAIAVHVPAAGGEIGYIPRQVAARWAPRLDSGAEPQAWVDGVRIARGHEDHPGIDVKVRWPR